MENAGESTSTVNLGPEYDQDVWKALRVAVKEAGGRVEDKQWAVAGSQEVVSLTIDIGGHVLVVGSETYIGTTITGESGLVESIARRVNALLGTS